jgi:hypothetical protein
MNRLLPWILLAFSGLIISSYQPMFSTVPNDGPYILYKGDSMHVYYIDSGSQINLRSKSLPLSARNMEVLQVATDEPGKFFEVRLKSKLEDEIAEYARPKKMLVLSDIEGNFGAFRKLLQAAGVIDANLQWIFGDGHLVLAGDFVDRGNMVTEVHWLIYALEDQAVAAKGKVHYILGNHEIMNMSGDLAYLHPKYLRNSELLQQHYMHLVGPESEIGRWLATKNIAERIGNLLFVHGGMSSYMNLMALPLKEVNGMARPYYTDSTFKYTDPKTEILFSEYGPFWYRGYYTSKSKATIPQIDSTLTIYNVKQVVTGHTIVAPHIATYHEGKVIDVDVHHAGGHSEALLIEKNEMVRINQKGERLPLTAFEKK